MLRLSLEVPTAKLEEWSPLLDLDFVLAHKVLKDCVYAKHFAQRPKGREVILDNSTHEFGAPIPFQDLTRAVGLVRADTVIAPDIVSVETADDRQFWQNIMWARMCREHMQREPCKVAGVFCGHTPDHRRFYMEAAHLLNLDMICFSFHIPQRLEWWEEFAAHEKFRRKRVHILGMISLRETMKWVEISERHPAINFSFDTCKPTKLGVQGILMENLPFDQNLRGGEVNSKAVLDMEHLTPEQDDCCRKNIEFLKTVCHGVWQRYV